ncbi:MAG: L-serine ammonia-lyase, iron-sulfur-dependent, subunit alpha [Proteobacteria bacterium]|nr:L-serine ammonia-lyase, iron-sulfur-dependent, subunit alpha [Pseudomonadota bacterium]MBU1452138.1 L-serine ammonia-lyase, iron-sulfur-dependent, subunit alpha [Pseudomonadota bacterium]MBU2467533.1 L-serine ammonia-lyase, iron-sulfur-dependent, subunit alpha [Pseudomonadota bacterium]MBU2517938.1 L-serine ammonia-lyase, iron-sulfur-dependent, subunit alpha [Pseudomonadota bacterium]
MPDYTIKDLLRLEVAPALGCTEPVAVALGAAAAASLLGGRAPESVRVWVDPNIFKNGMSVLIPGTGGLFGLDLAAALGALGGDPTRRLEVLDSVDEQLVARARKLLNEKKVSVDLLEEIGLKIKVEVKAGDQTGEAVITRSHDNISSLKLNGRRVKSGFTSTGGFGPQKVNLAELEEWLATRSLDEMIEMLDGLDQDDLDFIEHGVNFNLRLAEYGLKFGPGLGLGKCLDRLVRQKLMCRDMAAAARILTSAAADARMAGIKLPAMSSAGSGNHGLTATLPIWAARDFIQCSSVEVLRAIALSHVLTAYVKIQTGRLSAICGCSVAAGAGATGGIAYLLGGDSRQVAGAVNNLIQDLAGVICDGAKTGCAFKLATAAGSAVQSALLALQGVQVLQTEGIVGDSMENTARNLGMLSVEGMRYADHTILRILTTKLAPPE